MPRKPAKPPIEGFDVYVERFKVEHAKEWNEVRNGPFYYGLEIMAKCLSS